MKAVAMYSTVPLLSAAALRTPVSELMHEGYVAVGAAQPVAAAARLMGQHRIHAVLVVDDEHRPLGWVTSRGMLHNTPRDWTAATAVDAISEPLEIVAPSATLRVALDAFLATGASHVLVADSPMSPPAGVLAESDLLGVIADSLR